MLVWVLVAMIAVQQGAVTIKIDHPTKRACLERLAAVRASGVVDGAKCVERRDV